MDFQKKDLSNSRQEIKVTIAPEEVILHEEKALALFQKEISLEGFRRGHVPINIMREHISREQIFSQIVELAIQNAYQKIVQEESLQVLGEPEIRVEKAKEGESLVFTIQVSLFPSIILPDYKKIASLVEKQKVEVQKEELDKTLKWLQESKKKEDGTLPELNDEFAKAIGSPSGLTELKENVGKGLLVEKEIQEKKNR